VIASSYDANGNATTLTPPGRPAHTFTYTPVDLPSAYTPPAAGAGSTSTLASYNTDRQGTRITLPTGQAVDFGYDGAGRLTSATIARGAIGFAYSATTGHLTGVTSPGGINLSYAYDGGLQTGETWTGPVPGSVSRGYDSDFRVASQSVGGTAAVAYQYDADSLLIKAGDLTLSRSAQNGLLTSTTLSTVADTWAYTGFGEPSGYSATSGTNSLLSVQYTRDKLGRITQKTETIGGSTDTYSYMYDLVGRLTEVRKNGGPTASYTYDGNGNRLTSTDPSSLTSASYDAQDRLIQYGATVYTYNADGQLLNKTTDSQATAYQYDELGNLTGGILPNGARIDYVVDGQNRRVGKKVNGAVMQGLLYADGLRPIAELDGTGAVVARFVYASGTTPAYLVKGGATYRIVADHLGSPRLVVDAATGQVAQRLDYDAWGNVTSDTNPGFQPFGFAGGLYDRDIGLTRLGARDYDGESGRWTSKDPLGFAGRDPNLYTYAHNDPVNFIDSTGLYVEIISWQPTSSQSSYTGHITVDINGTAYDWMPPGAMRINSRDLVLRANDYRNGLGVRLELSEDDEKYIEDYIKSFEENNSNEYNSFSNNCTDPIEEALEDLGWTLGPNVSPNGLLGSIKRASYRNNVKHEYTVYKKKPRIRL
jgi:RHS repeat-associated protein